jgi:hypothetical protein
MNACAFATRYGAIGFGPAFHTFYMALVAYSVRGFFACKFTANCALADTLTLILLALIDAWCGSLCLCYTCKGHQQQCYNYVFHNPCFVNLMLRQRQQAKV